MMERTLTPKTFSESDSCKNIIFSIPLYQRLFEWGDEQIARLMYDLHQAFLAPSRRPYHIGMITTMPHSSTQDLVDGQQRFTVMTLLGVFFGWEKFIKIGNSTRLKFTARENDEIYMRYLADLVELSEVELMEVENDRMKVGLETIERYISDNNLPKKEFGEYIYSNLTFFVSELDENYTMTELNTYFERMNTTGKALEPHEILKVELLKQLKSSNKSVFTRLWNACSQMDTKLYKPKRYSSEVDEGEDISVNSYDNWRNEYNNAILTILRAKGDDMEQALVGVVDTMYNESEESDMTKIVDIEAMQDPSEFQAGKKNKHRKDTYTMLTFPEFLLQILYITLGRADSLDGPILDSPQVHLDVTEFFNIHKLLDTFKKYEGKYDIKEFYRNMLLYRCLLDYYFVCVSENDEEPYPFVPYRDSRRKAEIKQYETMLYASSSSMTYYYWIAPALVWLGTKVNETGGIFIDETEFLGTLITLDEVWHPNPFIKENWRESLRYDGNIDRYYFWRIDYYLWKNRAEFFHDEKQRNLAEHYLFRRNRSIEHVAPQHHRDDRTDFDWKEIKEQSLEDFKLLNDIGNLCMISSGLNSSLKDSCFEEKRTHIELFLNKSIIGNIESLKMLYIYGNYGIWSLDNIRDHSSKSVKWLKDSYEIGLI